MRKGAVPPAAKAGQALASAAMEIISKPALFELHAGCLPFQTAQVNHHPLRKAAKKQYISRLYWRKRKLRLSETGEF